MEIVILIIASFIGLAPASIARRKGRNFVLWWIYGSLIFLIALPHALLIRANQNAFEPAPSPETHFRCPDCRELVRKDAIKCKHCGIKLKHTEETNTVDSKIFHGSRDISNPAYAKFLVNSFKVEKNEVLGRFFVANKTFEHAEEVLSFCDALYKEQLPRLMQEAAIEEEHNKIREANFEETNKKLREWNEIESKKKDDEQRRNVRLVAILLTSFILVALTYEYAWNAIYEQIWEMFLKTSEVGVEHGSCDKDGKCIGKLECRQGRCVLFR